MWWVFLEVGLALGLAVGIVWWTFPKAKKPLPPERVQQEPGTDQDKPL